MKFSIFGNNCMDNRFYFLKIVLLISCPTIFEKEFSFFKCSCRKPNVNFEIVWKRILSLQFPDFFTIEERLLKSSCCAESILNIC